MKRTDRDEAVQKRAQVQRAGTFVDLFAGCGGLSLGLLNAGWTGSFVVEKDPMAFRTLRENLIDSNRYSFNWPDSLPKESFDVGAFNQRFWRLMKRLRGTVSLVAAGPPCQGFSFLGNRRKNDSRNRLYRRFLKVVELLDPDYLLLENVPGIDVPHGLHANRGNPGPGRPVKAFSHRIRDQLLENHGYRVYGDVIRAEDCGVAQRRPRYFMIGIKATLVNESSVPDPFELLEDLRAEFLRDKGLDPECPVSTAAAISDLEVAGSELVACEGHPRFRRIRYTSPDTPYQELLHDGLNGRAPNSLRLVNHREDTVRRFKNLQKNCRRGVQLRRDILLRHGIKKHQLVVLDPDKPAHTISTLPDDQLHYAEPRVLTVREEARLQSFPDWFAFRGKYTTGGKRRTREAPRYTQVGNAVAPFVAELIGRVLDELDRLVHS